MTITWTMIQRGAFWFAVGVGCFAITLNLGVVAIDLWFHDWSAAGGQALMLTVSAATLWLTIWGETAFRVRHEKLTAERDTMQLAYERFRDAREFSLGVEAVEESTRH